MTNTDKRIMEAFIKGEALKLHTTETDGRRVTFHGNEIARKTDRGVLVSFAGWPTRTTADKINALLRTLRADGRVWIKGPQKTNEKTLAKRTIMSTMHGTPGDTIDADRWYQIANIRIFEIRWTETAPYPNEDDVTRWPNSAPDGWTHVEA